MFVIHLMQYKWDENAPFPGYKTIAKQMGVSDKSARRYAQSLEQKGYIRREMRKGETNKFHITQLIAALEKIQKEKKPKSGPDPSWVPYENASNTLLLIIL